MTSASAPWKKELEEYYRFRPPSLYEMKSLVEALLSKQRQEILEEAAKVAENHPMTMAYLFPNPSSETANKIAQEIRGLKEKI